MLHDHTAADVPFALQNAAVLSLHRMAAAHKPLQEALPADCATLHPALRLDPQVQLSPLVSRHKTTGLLAASKKHTLYIWVLRWCLLSAQYCAVSTLAAIPASLETAPESCSVEPQMLKFGCIWSTLSTGP